MACLKLSGTDYNSINILMIVVNVGAMSILAFTNGVGSGTTTLDFVGHFLTNVVTTSL